MAKLRNPKGKYMSSQYPWIKKELNAIRESTGKNPTKKQQARTKRHIKQFEKQGWSDRDTWNLDVEFIYFIVPRLERFIEVTNGYPGGRSGMTEQKWNKTLNQMLEGFKICRDDGWIGMCPNQSKKVADAYRLFGEWAQHLWW
jgi:hypothetical protein